MSPRMVTKRLQTNGQALRTDQQPPDQLPTVICIPTYSLRITSSLSSREEFKRQLKIFAFDYDHPCILKNRQWNPTMWRVAMELAAYAFERTELLVSLRKSRPTQEKRSTLKFYCVQAIGYGDTGSSSGQACHTCSTGWYERASAIPSSRLPAVRIPVLLRLQRGQWFLGQLPGQTHQLLHTQLAGCSCQPQPGTKRRLHTFDELVRQQLVSRHSVQRRQSAIQQLLQAGEEHGRVRSGCHPGLLEPPNSSLAVDRRIELRFKDFLRGGPVHHPRASSGRIQGRLRLALEEGLQRRQITLVGLQPGRYRHLLKVLQEGPKIPILKGLRPRDLHPYPGHGTK
ncbi:hypothetical protein T265_01381 [Opisthorchis viverrini]|uniref:Uncharacterized protein n=1 Tax=Opisthorchis viverrini TaxID=6198 RepID=A0A074ZZJ0_OPIVI|nr:hypothetical protein T265_01381 [Opisthorchis viverrini]KER32501.1 hypothetical protein T265_01381 [Opisthorchis viverrini]